MIIRRSTLKAVLPAAVDKDKDARYALNKIEVRPDGRVTGTNGHLLISIVERYPFPDADYPTAGLPEFHGNPPAAITIDLPIVETLIKTAPKRSVIPIIAEGIQLGQNSEGAYVASTDLQSQTVIRLPQGEKAGRFFSNWDQSVPAADEPAIHLTLGAKLLQILCKAALAINDRNASITFAIRTDPKHQTQVPGATNDDPRAPTGVYNDAVRVELGGTDHTAYGAIMPMRK